MQDWTCEAMIREIEGAVLTRRTSAALLEMPENASRCKHNAGINIGNIAMSAISKPLHIEFPISLDGSVVRLEAIRPEHADLFLADHEERS